MIAGEVREVCGSVRVRKRNIWRNDVLKVAVERMEILGARNEAAKERCMEVYKEEKRNVKRCIYFIKRRVNEKFGRNMSQDVIGSRKLFWKKVIKVNGRKVNSCSRIRD